MFKSADPDENIVVWYNNRGWIAPIAYMNAVSNLALRALLTEKDPSKYSIKLINHPLPITKRQLEDEIEWQANVSLLRAISIVWAMAFIPATYAVYLVEERSCGFKHLQFTSGLNRALYWIHTLCWDFFVYGITAAEIVIVFIIYNETAYVGEHSIGAFIVILLSYGFVSITFIYPATFLFTVPSNAFIAISCYNVFMGILALFTTFVLGLVTTEEDPFYIESIMQFLPQYAFGKAVLNMATENLRVQTLLALGITSYPNLFEWNMTLKYIIFMLVVGVIFFVIALIIQFRLLRKIGLKKELRRQEEFLTEFNKENEDEDYDVKKERERVTSGEAKNDGDLLIVNNVSKIYEGAPTPSVNHVCVGVKRGECFGLLGLNGAGKTTMFKMLTGK